jgi:hypothetical protein
MGRHSKGERHAFAMRLARDLWQLLRDVARVTGTDPTSLIAGFVAEKRGVLTRKLEKYKAALANGKETP